MSKFQSNMPIQISAAVKDNKAFVVALFGDGRICTITENGTMKQIYPTQAGKQTDVERVQTEQRKPFTRGGSYEY